MKIGITCYPTFGGSGVVATELGIALAERGDEVHFISYALPSRLDLPRERVHFHEVVAPSYPLFVSPPYTLALATKMAEVAAHAQPRPAARPLRAAARDLGDPRARDGRTATACRLKVVTTLHGTDITIVGQDRSYLPITRWGIEQSDAVTAVSRYLRDVTVREFGVQRDDRGRPELRRHAAVPARRRLAVRARPRARRRGAHRARLELPPGQAHRATCSRSSTGSGGRIPARLLLIGDGPDRSLAERLAREGGFEDRTTFLGNVAADRDDPARRRA